MVRFLLRGLISMGITLLLVSITLFGVMELGSGDVTVRILGTFATPEQRASYRAQLGLDQPAWLRYVDWLAGNDWRVASQVGYPLITLPDPQTGEQEWWADVEGTPTQWRMREGELQALERQPDGSTAARSADSVWQGAPQGSLESDQLGSPAGTTLEPSLDLSGDLSPDLSPDPSADLLDPSLDPSADSAEDPPTDPNLRQIFWGVDTQNNAVMWVKGEGETVYILTQSGMRRQGDGPRRYIPLRKGLLRGDPGLSLQTGRPVAITLLSRLRNTTILAGTSFLVIMPVALALGILAGVNEGRWPDRLISILGLWATATPEFVTGIFLILILGIWLRVLPAVSVFLSDDAIFRDPKLLALPVLTLTAVELGYISRMTRASLVEVMAAPYIRTAILKGMPYWRVVLRHGVPNALMAPITVIMLHVNWLVGGVVVVESIFGFPGLGKYIYDSAVFGDFNAIQAAALVMVVIAVVTRLLGDLIYTLLNPRIRQP